MRVPPGEVLIRQGKNIPTSSTSHLLPSCSTCPTTLPLINQDRWPQAQCLWPSTPTPLTKNSFSDGSGSNRHVNPLSTPNHPSPWSSSTPHSLQPLPITTKNTKIILSANQWIISLKLLRICGELGAAEVAHFGRKLKKVNRPGKTAYNYNNNSNKISIVMCCRKYSKSRL